MEKYELKKSQKLLKVYIKMEKKFDKDKTNHSNIDINTIEVSNKVSFG